MDKVGTISLFGSVHQAPTLQILNLVNLLSSESKAKRVIDEQWPK